jgi:hypothetical protein
VLHAAETTFFVGLAVPIAAAPPVCVAAPRLVGLLDQRAVRCIGVATIGLGVTAVTPGCVAARCRGVATIGLGVTTDRDGNRVAVADLGVARVGVSAFAARRVGFTAIRLGAALLDG